MIIKDSSLEERCGFTLIECEILWERRDPNFIEEGNNLKPLRKKRRRNVSHRRVEGNITKSNKEKEKRIIEKLWE